MNVPAVETDQPTLFGHPTGLYTLFFAEMWERFSYYGMRALLVFYMIKGFLGYGDSKAYGVYGAYTALVYMTPFFGGMIADRIMGPRKAVVIGGILMAAGHLLMTIESELWFFFALALLIAGNGFFKPNISTIVGSLYRQGSSKRDGGFTIFYIGINLGAAMSPLLCGYIGETYGYHRGFGLATVGMLVGLAVFVMPTRLTQGLIGAAALASAVSLILFRPENPFATAVNIFVALALVTSGTIACIALNRGGLPAEAGAAPKWNQGLFTKPDLLIYLGTFLAIPLFALLVSGFSILRSDGSIARIVPEQWIENLQQSDSGFANVASIFVSEISKPAGLVLTLTGIVAIVYLLIETFRLDKVPRQRMYVVLILTFFAMLFWSFFEQAGSSVNNFTDRNIDRVAEVRTITADDVGQTIDLQPTQEQLGYVNGDQLFTMSVLDSLRKNAETDPSFEISWTVSEQNIGMGIAPRDNELPASIFQAVNPGYILILGLVFSALWTYLGSKDREPSTPVKFSLGLMQLGFGFAAFWYGAQEANDRGMVAVGWLMLGYLFQTTGELCLSPVGLSMITRLSPSQLVSTTMGAWFLATAFSQYLAAIISQFTGVSHESGGEATIPVPSETVNVYGDVFGIIAMWAIGSGVFCLCMSPLLTKWMHEDVQNDEDEASS
ncbi:MAG: oligopeptide:H+ symporter [Pirellulaceae bacterium]